MLGGWDFGCGKRFAGFESVGAFGGMRRDGEGDMHGKGEGDDLVRTVAILFLPPPGVAIEKEKWKFVCIV